MMVSRRVLNDLRAGLQVRLQFAGPRPKGANFDNFLKKHGVVCKKKVMHGENMLVADVDSFDNYDRLIAKKKATIDGAAVQFLPLNLLDPRVYGRKRNLVNVSAMREKRKKFVSNQVEDFDAALAAFRDPTVKRVKAVDQEENGNDEPSEIEDHLAGNDENFIPGNNDDDLVPDDNDELPDEDFAELPDDIMASDGDMPDVFANMPEDFVMPGENENLPDDDFVEMPDDGDDDDVDLSHINEDDLEDY